MKILKFVIFSSVLFPFSLPALEQQFDDNTIRLNVSAGTGFYGNNHNSSDYLLRAQFFHTFTDDWKLGVVYAYDAQAHDYNKFAKDAFLYAEAGIGRLELGWTESVAAKMALTLPDVGGTRINNAGLFYKDDFYGITNPTIRGTQYALRANAVTSPDDPWQIGIGVTFGNPDGFNQSIEVGAKYKSLYGDTKTSISLGYGYTDKPRGMIGDWYLAPTFADYRQQATIGFNLQYGSLLWAITAKATYDTNPIGLPTDGLQAGTGFSYDFLSWSASINYILSDVGLWQHDDEIAHTGVFSLRKKITKNFNVWGSTGLVRNDKTNYFVFGGLGVTF